MHTQTRIHTFMQHTYNFCKMFESMTWLNLPLQKIGLEDRERERSPLDSCEYKLIPTICVFTFCPFQICLYASM